MVRKRDLCAQDYEDLRRRKTEMINEHLVECYNRLLKEEDINLLIRLHRNFINKMMLNGNAKNKYKTIDFSIFSWFQFDTDFLLYHSFLS